MRRHGWLVVPALLALCTLLTAAEPPPIAQASCRATLTEAALVVEATLQVTPPERRTTAVRLLPKAYPLVGELLRSQAAQIVLRDDAYWLQLQPVGRAAEPKPVELTFAFRAPIARDRGTRACTLPVLPAARVLFDLPAELYDLHVAPPAPVEAKDGRQLLYAPAARRLALGWKATPPPPAVAPEFRADADTTVTVGLTSLTAEAALEVAVLQGELRELTLALPAGHQLRAVQGKAIRRWVLAGGKVKVELKRPERKAVELSVRTEMLASADGEFAWRPVEVEGARHQGGRAYFRALPGLQLQAVGREGFERVSDGYARDAAAGRQTLVLAYPTLPASVRLAVDRLEPRLTASVAALAHLERGIVTLRAAIDYTIQDVGVRQLQVNVGEGADVLEVHCPSLLDHETAAGVLTVRLRDALEDKAQLRLVVQRPIEREDGVVIPRLTARDVERQSGVVGVAAGADVELRHRRADQADQIDLRLLPDWVQKLGPKLAYRYYDRLGSLVAVETAPVQPEFDVVASEQAALSEDGWVREIAWACTVQRGEVFAWSLRVPDGVVPLELDCRAPRQAPAEGRKPGPPPPRESVVKDWELDEAARVLKVALARGLTGQVELLARFSQRLGEPTGALALHAVELEGARRTSGRLVLQPRIAVSLRATRADGLEATAGEAGQLAFTLEAAAWQLDLDSRRIEPVVTVDAVTVLGVRPGQVAADALLRFTIAKAPVNELTVRLPEGAVNSTVQTSDLKSTQLTGRDWTVRFARKIQGRCDLRVTYDHVIPVEGGSVTCGTLEAPGTARCDGFLAVARDSGRIEVALEQPEGLFEVDPAAVPRWGAASGRRAVLAAFRHTGPARLTARIDVLDRADVLEAKALGAIVETVLREDGQAVTELAYDIRNVRRQFLRVELPPDAALLGAYVNGAPVTSATGPDGATLVPLMAGRRAEGGTRQGEDILEVSVLYAQQHAPLAGGRTVKLASPRVDVRTEALSWAVYLPPGYRAADTDGNMRLLSRPPQDRPGRVAGAMLAEESRLLDSAVRAIGRILEVVWLYFRRYIGRVLIALGVAALVVAAVVLLRRWARAPRQQAREGRTARSVLLQPVRRRFLVGLFVCVLVVVLLAGMFLPTLSRAREEARRIRARNNLNQIAKAMATYLNEYGDNRFYPSSMEQLRSICPDESIFYDPTSGRRVVYLYEGQHVRDDFPPNEPMAYMQGAGGVSVVFFDSHVEFYPYGSDQLARTLPGRDLREPPEGQWRYGGTGGRWHGRRAPGTMASPSTGVAGGRYRAEAEATALVERLQQEMEVQTEQKEQQARALVANGDTYFSAQNWKDARAHYEKALALDPTNTEARDKLGKTATMLGMSEEEYSRLAAKYTQQLAVARDVQRTELRRQLEDGKRLIEQGRHAEAAETLARVTARAKYLAPMLGGATLPGPTGAGEGGGGGVDAGVSRLADEAERYLRAAIAASGQVQRGRANELLAQLEGDLAKEELDYGQRKLLDRIVRRSQQDDFEDKSREGHRPGAKPAPKPVVPGIQPAVERDRLRPDREPARPPAKRPEGTQTTPEPPGQPAQPGPGVVGGGKEAVDRWGFGAQRVTYAAVHRGRQKGALPIRLELPSEAALPYIFHRPVTNRALGEVELDCQRLGASRWAKGILLVGAVGLVALVGLGAATRRKQSRKPSDETSD